MELLTAPVAQFGFLMRRPVAEVFNAFVDPEITSKFWFMKGTGRLDDGAIVLWYFTEEISCKVRVLAFEENRRLLIEWAATPETATTVEWNFEARSEDTTYVNVVNQGFSGDGDQVVKAALDSTGGFAIVLAAAKVFLEHGLQLNLSQDRF